MEPPTSSSILRKSSDVRWINGQKPHLIRIGFRIQCNTENFVPVVVLGLSASSSSSSSTSTPMTPSKEIDHSDHPPVIVSSESVDRQVRRDPYGTDHHPAIVQVKVVWRARTERPIFFCNIRIKKPNKNENHEQVRETRIIPTCWNGCKNSERILWMTEFLNHAEDAMAEPYLMQKILVI